MISERRTNRRQEAGARVLEEDRDALPEPVQQGRPEMPRYVRERVQQVLRHRHLHRGLAALLAHETDVHLQHRGRSGRRQSMRPQQGHGHRLRRGLRVPEDLAPYAGGKLQGRQAAVPAHQNHAAGRRAQRRPDGQGGRARRAVQEGHPRRDPHHPQARPRVHLPQNHPGRAEVPRLVRARHRVR